MPVPRMRGNEPDDFARGQILPLFSADVRMNRTILSADKIFLLFSDERDIFTQIPMRKTRKMRVGVDHRGLLQVVSQSFRFPRWL